MQTSGTGTSTPGTATGALGRTRVVSAVGRVDDLAAVLGPRRPGAGACWCTAYRESGVPNDERPAYMASLCEDEPGPGVLAYVDDAPAGWCSVAPRSTYHRLTRSRTIPFADDRDPWSVVCFVVLPPFRRRGLMHVLLDGAVAHARSHGGDVVEGYPVEAGDGRVDGVSGYVGTTRLFERAGFAPVLQTTSRHGGRTRWLVRKEL